MSAEVTETDVQRFLAGDESVLDSLVRALGPSITAVLCARFPLLRPYVEDLLAESLFRVWLRRQEFDPAKGTLYSWWLAIAQNVARSMRRAGWQQARACEAGQEDDWLLEVAGGREPAPGDYHPEAAPVELSAEQRAFWEVLAELTDVDRRIILYHAQMNGEGAWAVELAGELGLSAGAIRVRRVRAMKRLQAELKKRGYVTQANQVGA